jgi:hypothetical protein
MKFTNASKTLIRNGYEVKENGYNGIEATKTGCRTIEVAKNGNEDLVAAIQVSNSYPTTLKRAIVLSETLGQQKGAAILLRVGSEKQITGGKK